MYFLWGLSYTTLKSPLTVMQNFQFLHGCYGNQGRSGVNFKNTIRLPDPENRRADENSPQFITGLFTVV